MKTLLFQRIVPPYRVGVFKELCRQTKTIVVHSREERGAALKDCDDLPFPSVRVGRIYFGLGETAMIQNFLPLLIEYRPKRVISEFGLKYLTLWGLLFFRRVLGYELWVWTHGVENHDLAAPFKSFRGRITRFLLNQMDGVIAYSEGRAKILRANLTRPKITVASNTLDTDYYKTIYSRLHQEGVASVRARLGWKEKFHVTTIGRLVPGKAVEKLTEVFALIPKDLDVAFHIIGDGPLKSKLQSQKGFYLHGEIWGEEESSKLLYASDLVFNPGRVGLSIIHAFSMGVPMLTCAQTPAGPFHSPEIEYLIDGENGWIVNSDSRSLAGKLKEVLTHPDQIQSAKTFALKTAYEKVTLQAMLKGFSASS